MLVELEEAVLDNRRRIRRYRCIKKFKIEVKELLTFL
jgi:hypothetical protein